MRLENTTPFATNFTLALDKQGHEVIVLVVRGTFTLSDTRGVPTLVAPVQLPLIEADVFGPDPALDAPVFETDFAHFRPRCDVLCHARAHAPRGEPATTSRIGWVGAMLKRGGNPSRSSRPNTPVFGMPIGGPTMASASSSTKSRNSGR